MWSPLRQRRWDSAVKWNGEERNDLTVALWTRGQKKNSDGDTFNFNDDDEKIRSWVASSQTNKVFVLCNLIVSKLHWSVTVTAVMQHEQKLGCLPRSGKAECKCQVLCPLGVKKKGLRVKKFFFKMFCVNRDLPAEKETYILSLFTVRLQCCSSASPYAKRSPRFPSK